MSNIEINQTPSVTGRDNITSTPYGIGSCSSHKSSIKLNISGVNLPIEPFDFASNYDYCMVLPTTETGEFSDIAKGYLGIIITHGFEYFIYQSNRKREFLLLLRLPIIKLRKFADKIEFPMLLDQEVLEDTCTKGCSEDGVEPFEIAHRPDITSLYPYEYIYSKYSQYVHESLYWRPINCRFIYPYDHPFRDSIRIKIIPILINSCPLNDDIDMNNPLISTLTIERIDLLKSIKNHTIKSFFPLHNPILLEDLSISFLSYPWQELPLFEIKEYFGEKIALQFAFLNHIVVFLILPSLIGIPLQIIVWYTKNYSATFLPAYAYFISVWGIIMLEYWKQKEKMYAIRWGTVGYEENEKDRPDFEGENIKSFIDGSTIKYFPSKHRLHIFRESITMSLFIGGLVVGSIASIYIARSFLNSSLGGLSAQFLGALLNALQILITTLAYIALARWLTDRENHRTDTVYEESLIYKLFVFQFINCYGSFFYISFFGKIFGECQSEDCMQALSFNLGVVYGARLFFRQFWPPFRRSISNTIKYYNQTRKVDTPLSRPEREYLLDHYCEMMDNLFNYVEACFQYGYCALFSSALPIASLFTLFAAVLEIRRNGWLFVRFFQRPKHKAAENIGKWQLVFLFLTIASVVTNASLSVFTMSTFDTYSLQLRYWIYILFQWTCFLLQLLIMLYMPTIPIEIIIQRLRANHITNKIIDRQPDDKYFHINRKETNKQKVDSKVINIQSYPIESELLTSSKKFMLQSPRLQTRSVGLYPAPFSNPSPNNELLDSSIRENSKRTRRNSYDKYFSFRLHNPTIKQISPDEVYKATNAALENVQRTSVLVNNEDIYKDEFSGDEKETGNPIYTAYNDNKQQDRRRRSSKLRGCIEITPMQMDKTQLAIDQFDTPRSKRTSI